MAYTFSREADADFEAIYEYSLREFGQRQADRYATNLLSAFDLLVTHPEAGKIRQDCPTFRCLTCGSHLIFYSQVAHDIIIVRILHHSQDPLRHL